MTSGTEREPAKHRLPGIYGLTESTGGVLQLDPADHDPDGPRAHLLRSAGKPLPWVELRVADTETGAELAMIPIENSLHGRITDIHHLLPTSGLHIIGEHFLPIHFQLMAPVGAKLDGIRFVHSQIPALGQ